MYGMAKMCPLFWVTDYQKHKKKWKIKHKTAIWAILGQMTIFDQIFKKIVKFRHHDSCLDTKLPQGCPVSLFRPVLDTLGTFFGRFLVF